MYQGYSTGETYKIIEAPEENNGLYYIRVEMVDGSSQIIQISKEQAVYLGLDLANGTPNSKVLQPCLATSDDSTQGHIEGETHALNLRDGNTGNDNGRITEYRILHPLEMNLRPLKKEHFLPIRGRLKRSMDIITAHPIKKAKAVVRTRSGRVTVPPKHIQDIYKRFIDSTDIKTDSKAERSRSRSNSPILIGDFTPLRTNDEQPPLLTVATVKSTIKNDKKRLVAQFRCTTCNKAYLGKRKMRKHLKMFPNHTSQPTLHNIVDDKTWNALIDTSKMAREGERGAKFCREVLTLLTNAKTLVRYFFKLQKKLETYENIEIRNESDIINEDTGLYLMNELLAKVFGIEKGWYSFNENELCKDVSIFSFLENFDSKALSGLSINDSEVKANVNIEPIQQTGLLPDRYSESKASKIMINQNKEIFLSNDILVENVPKVNVKKLQENRGIKPFNYDEKTPENVSPDFLNDKISTLEEHLAINEDSLTFVKSNNFAVEREEFIIENRKINTESTCHIIVPNQKLLSDTNAAIIDIDKSITTGNSSNCLEDRTEDTINVQHLKYRMREVVVENLDIPPLEIFQFDSNQ